MFISWRVVTLVPETACVYNWKGPTHLVTISPLGHQVATACHSEEKPPTLSRTHEPGSSVRHPSKKVFYL